MKWIFIVGAAVAVIAVTLLISPLPDTAPQDTQDSQDSQDNDTTTTQINSFEECVQAGNPVMESFPRRCSAGDKTFTEDIGNEQQLQDTIRTDSPRPNTTVTSPLEVTGEARGTWYFEADFPIRLLDGNGNEIATGIAQAQDDWMTEDFVPFEATLEFEEPATEEGTLVLEKSNPSGLPENEAQLTIPISFASE